MAEFEMEDQQQQVQEETSQQSDFGIDGSNAYLGLTEDPEYVGDVDAQEVAGKGKDPSYGVGVGGAGVGGLTKQQQMEYDNNPLFEPESGDEYQQLSLEERERLDFELAMRLQEEDDAEAEEDGMGTEGINVVQNQEMDMEAADDQVDDGWNDGYRWNDEYDSADDDEPLLYHSKLAKEPKSTTKPSGTPAIAPKSKTPTTTTSKTTTATTKPKITLEEVLVKVIPSSPPSTVKCGSCNQQPSESPIDIVTIITKHRDLETLAQHCTITCESCNDNLCIACLESTNETNIIDHCANLRMVLVCAALMRLESKEETTTTLTPKPTNQSKSSKKLHESETKQDNQIIKILTYLQKVLPDSSSSLLANLLPNSNLFVSLQSSKLLPTLEIYLRNDSMMDMTARSEIYLCVLGLLKIMASHEVTVRLLTESQMEGDTSHPTILELLVNLVRQADVFIRTTQMIEGLDNDEECVDAIGVALEVKSAAEDVERTVRSSSSVGGGSVKVKGKEKVGHEKKVEGGGEKDEWIREYERVMKPLTYDVAEFGDVQHQNTYQNPNYNYKKKRNQQHQQQHDQNSTSNAPEKRTLRIVKEIATLATTLPCTAHGSIYLRVREDDVNKLRVVISGPFGTPYCFGLFEFDIFLGAEYPVVPPNVKLLTTGNGTVRFNPNLYNCGKVCLSLLGTWQGPGWTPNKSTVLQVLLSIQSLIMVEHPYRNEPGYENTRDTDPRNCAYTLQVRRDTVKWAILDMMVNPPKGFESVIQKHFTLIKTELLKTLRQWQSEDPDWNGNSDPSGFAAVPYHKGKKNQKGKGKNNGMLNEEGRNTHWELLIWQVNGKLEKMEKAEKERETATEG
ncbi:Baculoviral IAP repeat-containing protein 6 [Blyttiomyces sp. JEL0837]|nr:Baculoviral IAP repeat-containing protein 6 [Blyttiomyces sp. JEL0837]